MNDEPGAAPEPDEPPPGRSRYEDFDLADLQAGPQQGAARPTGRRTPLLTVAAIVLAVSGLMPILVVIGFHPGGGAEAALLVWGILCLATAALVFLLVPVGRPLGIAVGCIGVVIGVLSARHSAVNGLIAIGLTGYVIYACAVSGPSFRRG
jgi:hypothetical protein